MRDGRLDASYSNQLDQCSPTPPSTSSVAVPITISGPPSPPPTMPSASSPTPTPIDTMAELTKQFSQMVLAVTAGFNNLQQVQQHRTQTIAQGSTSGTIPTTSAPTPQSPQPPRCMYCDILGHLRKHCKEFAEALRTSLIRWGGNGRIINSATGLELPLMFGKGGMKVLIPQQPTAMPPTAMPTTVTTNGIMLNSRYGTIGEGTVLNTTLDFENNVRIDEIIDVDVNEKRKRGSVEQARRVRSRTDDTPTPEPRVTQRVPQPVQMEEVPDEDMPDIPVQPYQTRRQAQASAPAPAPTA